MSFLASSSSSKPILTIEYDVFLTFFNNGRDVDRARTFLENRLREAGLKTLVSDIVNDYTWKMIESCRIVMVLITPELVRSQIWRLMNILSQPKTVLPFFYGVVIQNHLREQLESLNLQLGRAADRSLLFGFRLSDDLG
ncbi:hypothetical protein K1719_022875 [Acacia pycnantha]|nr:hypothetical protein K1719_022875 [Acacia pycnantha]